MESANDYKLMNYSDEYVLRVISSFSFLENLISLESMHPALY